MTAMAAEVADGLLVMPFHTRRSLAELTRPNLEIGLDRAGRAPADLTVVCEAILCTGRDEAELATADAGARTLVAFYGATPAYRPVLEVHGWGELQTDLHGLSKQGRWSEMAALVDDEVLSALVDPRDPEGGRRRDRRPLRGLRGPGGGVLPVRVFSRSGRRRRGRGHVGPWLVTATDPAAVTDWEAAGRRIEVAGRDVFVLDVPPTGEVTGPPVLVLHGFPSASFDYRHVLRRAARRSPGAPLRLPRLRALGQARPPLLDRAPGRRDRGRGGRRGPRPGRVAHPRHGRLRGRRGARSRPRWHARLRDRAPGAHERFDLHRDGPALGGAAAPAVVAGRAQRRRRVRRR